MSDLCLYELEDNVWDEFGDSDDHIVPDPGNKHADKSLTDSDSRKKPRSEVISVTSNADISTPCYIGGKEKRSIPTLTNNNAMLEKGSWSDTPDGVFPSCDTDSIKEVTSLASDDLRISNHSFKSGNIEPEGSEFCVDDSLMGDGYTAVDHSLYRYPLNRIPQTGNELSFFDNDREDKENGDLLYYGWPDIGNFEDVHRMFRSCDSTFGMESPNNDEELSWFSSSNATEGSEDALKSGLKFAGPNAGSSKGDSEHYEAFKPDGLGTKSESRDILMPKEQDSSCMSSVLDDISLEATSFLQLQEVMEKLDVRTKLCIRDSLYRLARSAERRHSCANQKGGIKDSGDATGAPMVEETNKCTGFMDMETDTNPIDRSIAHLLFHRPSDPSRVPSNDSLSRKSHALIRESVSSPPVMAEKQVCEEETLADGGKETLITDDG